MMPSVRALPLEKFVNLCVAVAVAGCWLRGLHSVDGRVASHEIVAGGVVL